MSDLREAAERLKNHAWLSRFRQADYENKYNELSPCACNDIAGYVDKFLDLVLAEHPADDDTPIDEQWLRETGFIGSGGFNKSGPGLWLDVDGRTVCRVDHQWYWEWRAELPSQITTRGQLRKLLSALVGIGKETT